ncbi:MAG: EAL domain-containing protein [Gammaproteobacteria bacterium]|nr:EAL domain-containing protein [Gammaproteobacteria bacterium]
MNSLRALEELADEKYLALATALFGDAPLGYFWRDGRTLATVSSVTSEDERCAQAFIARNPSVLVEATKGAIEGHSMLCHPVILADGDSAGVLVCMGAPGDYPNARRNIEVIARFIESELNLVSELSEMATDLTERYEDLNLLFHADKQDAPELTITQIRRQLSACAQHLNVAGAILFVPDYPGELGIFPGQRDLTSQATERYWEKLREPIWQRLQSGVPAVVANDVTGDLDIAHLPVRVLSVPVGVGRTHKPMGYLTVLRSPTAREFLNSHRAVAISVAERFWAGFRMNHDPISRLLTRDGFLRRLAQSRQESPDQTGTLFCFDIDQFRLLNDTAGVAAGDELLTQIGQRLAKSGAHIVGRIGPDEFAALFVGQSDQQAIEQAQTVLDEISARGFSDGNRQISIGLHGGIASFTGERETIKDVFAQAETACEIAKRKERNTIHVYDAADKETNAHLREVNWAPRIHDAIENDRFRLFAQKIVPIAFGTGEPMHFEVLLRYQERDGTILSPDAFIPAAERFRLMPQVDHWVINKAIEMLADLRSHMPHEQLRCAINLSGQSVAEPAFVDQVIRNIRASGLPFDWFSFEITETATISNLTMAVEFINVLRAYGCKFALDDFGTGVSSFAYLRELPVDYLKIDGSFVRNMASNLVDDAIVESISRLGQLMRLRTVAEFVSDTESFQRLAELGVDYAQGYFLHKPQPLEELLMEQTRSQRLVANL